MAPTKQNRQAAFNDTFGCDPHEFKEMIERSPTFNATGPGMVIMSILSDCQELLATIPTDDRRAANLAEAVRKELNKAKFLIDAYKLGRPAEENTPENKPLCRSPH